MQKYYDKATLSSIFSAYSNTVSEDSLEQLAKKTIYKIILSKDKDDFPYVNIATKNKIENNLTSTFYKNESRDKAKAHLKAIFEGASNLFIYDKYCNDNSESVESFAKECFPEKKLNIFYPSLEGSFDQDLCAALKRICSDWKIKENKDQKINSQYEDLHDRYIIIDNQIQIIFTSGIDYLMSECKDFTYIVRTLA
ncbi:hypothetical protein HPMG_00025 [Helicobacter pullorum MIT 98-5489]|uniref:Uncharacterized protein n=2 Tax=Helicobacter pullorum TaxID=35818 RepID=C5EX24_9HELI|nr:hypothetical protein HPMG_00025 [Helicobacter pullorum MIT 98-5489]